MKVSMKRITLLVSLMFLLHLAEASDVDDTFVFVNSVAAGERLLVASSLDGPGDVEYDLDILEPYEDLFAPEFYGFAADSVDQNPYFPQVLRGHYDDGTVVQAVMAPDGSFSYVEAPDDRPHSFLCHFCHPWLKWLQFLSVRYGSNAEVLFHP